MAAKKMPRPTEGELEILAVLWRLGPATVRQVHQALSDEKPRRYTTTLKQLQIMAEKGLVRRDDSRRSHIYKPACSRERTQRRLVGDLLDKAFGGSARGLVMQALSRGDVSGEELAEIRSLLDEMQQGTDDDSA